MGVSNDTSANDDLQAIYQGGEYFMARMKALTDQRTAIEQMLGQLKLGREARAAYDEAQRLREQATDELAKARTEAESVRSSAQVHASETINEAKANAQKLNDDALENRRIADGLKHEAEQHHRNASEIAANMNGKLAELDQAKRNADAVKAKAQRLFDHLQNAIAEASSL